jgi:integrase
MRRLERDVFPWLGKRPIADIKAPELLAPLRRIESRGALESAHRAMQNCGQVFRYAVATGRAERDPSGDLRGAIPPPKEKHHASILEPKRIAELLRTIDTYQGYFVTRAALRLRRWSSSVRASCVRHSGGKSISTNPNGASLERG